MSNFHHRVMNLEPDYSNPESHAVVYKRGFRDARHAAADIANEADALATQVDLHKGIAEFHAKAHGEIAARLAEAERERDLAVVEARILKRMVGDYPRGTCPTCKGTGGVTDSASAKPYCWHCNNTGKAQSAQTGQLIPCVCTADPTSAKEKS